MIFFTIKMRKKQHESSVFLSTKFKKINQNAPPFLNPYFRFFSETRGFRRVNSHFGLLGLGVATRFLQKVRARP